MKKVFTCILLFFCVAAVFAQRPKIGLSLSGGGAKGAAHIGLLKVIDSAGIRIDYITGTSMGAVIGGLYAIGYTGNDLDKIARNARWDLLISNNIPLSEINIEEKDESGRYVAELPMVGLKPSIPLGAIEGQELNKLLSNLTFPVHQITSFDSLPISFRCIGADIITGESVLLDKGYLPTAMRASMAIPSVFTPVKIDGHLLVDGGLVHNFPVTDVKKMGADIVIGGYTGGRLYTEEELNSAIKLIYQSASFNRIADSKMQMGLCNILADYDLELQEYSAASFKNIDSIIDIGYRVALELYPQLKQLADSLNMADISPRPPLQRYYSNDICVSQIYIEGASEESLPLVWGKLNLTEGVTYDIDQINDAINRVYGTRFFDKVYYTIEPTVYGNQITVHVKESRKAAFKFGLHYDNEQASGILVNLTLRNVLGRGSRVLATLDVAEYPKVRINYQKFINKKQNLWAQAGYHYELIPYRLYNFGRLKDELINSYNNFYMGINKTLTKNSYMGFSINNELNFTRAKIYPEDRANPDTFAFRNIESNEFALNFNYSSNTLNSFLFPTSGSRTFLNIKFIPTHKYNINFYIADSAFADNRLEVYSRVTPALKISLSHTAIKTINNGVAWVNNFFAGVIIDDFIQDREFYTDGAVSGLFFIGGPEQRQRINTVPFIGYRETELEVGQALVISSQLQVEAINKFFISPSVSFQATGQRFNKYVANFIRPNFKYQNFENGINHGFGYGITFAYNWFGGPISLTVYKATGVADYRGYFTFGYKF